MLKDLRFGLRVLAKQPIITAIAVLTLALGIGTTSAVFSLIQGVLLKPPPYLQPNRLVLISSIRADGDEKLLPPDWSPERWQGWQRDAKSFESLAGYLWSFNFLVLDEGSESLEGMYVTPDYFRVMGLEPVIGRTFLESDRSNDVPPVIIIGYDLWQRKFGGDPNVIGQTLRISRQKAPLTVIGVMPPGIRFLPSRGASKEPNYNVNAKVDFWRLVIPDVKQLKDPAWNVVARLSTGTTPEQAQAELASIDSGREQSDPTYEGISAKVIPLTTEMNREGQSVLLPLLGAAALVLLIACGNVAALLLVRGLGRQQEYAVRCALGAGRLALFRQVITESLLTALAGGALGIGLAFAVIRVFKLIGGHAIPRLDAVTTGWPVLICGLASAIVAAVLAGIFPAIRASGLDPIESLRSEGPRTSAGRAERRLLRGVTIAQTALTLSLLVGAGLLIRTMNNLANVQSGYKTDHVLTMSVTAVQGDWTDFHRRALERVGSVSGVEHVAFAWGVPLTGNSWPDRVSIEGQPAAKNENELPSIPLRAVTEDYFNLLGLSIMDGREFRSTDIRKAPEVAIVNQALVDRYFAGTNPIGKKLWISGPKQPPDEIVGIVSNTRTSDLTQAAEPEIYLSLWQASAFSKHLVVRTTLDPSATIAAIQSELRAVDPTAAVENIKTLEQIRGDSQASRNFATQLLIGFAGVASVLTLVGIYGVLSLSVTSRTREIAIRSAVGAQKRDILALVFGEGLKLTAIGVALGVAVSIGLSRVLTFFLFGVQPTDPQTFFVVGILFVGVALLACWVPARRASRVDPAEALRCD